QLKLHQCGLPKQMALELFKPFVMKRLVDLNHAQNIKSAKRMVERARPVVWDVLEEVITEHPVLLNRAPTLHRLGIQAFEPQLVEGKAIQIHPLVCTAFNADFDGDQMAVHLPLSAEAQAEARILMLSSNNILSPADGRPITAPTQDMVLGLYHLTTLVPSRNEADGGRPHAFGSTAEAIMAYDKGALGLQERALIRLDEVFGVDNGKVNEPWEQPEDWTPGQPALVSTSLGRVLFNEALHEDEARKIEREYERGQITDSERRAELIEIWTRARAEVSQAMVDNFPTTNPVWVMVNSGARGNMMQISQIAGMRGLVANPKGEIIPRPIKANFREGLSVLEYFISTHGARKGLADTALRTADSGYLTRRL